MAVLTCVAILQGKKECYSGSSNSVYYFLDAIKSHQLLLQLRFTIDDSEFKVNC